MTVFVQGQRWVIDSEPDLGLGTVVGSDNRTVTLFFEQVETERRYSTAQAPLTRIQFEPGETITTSEGVELVVEEVIDHENFFIYDCGDEQLIPESALSSHIELNNPLTRLMTSQLDHPKWFKIRRSLDQGVQKVWNADVNGLLGTRASLLPHQIYIAHAATSLEKTRVLLSDEVGLGKTIEAGLILSRLLQKQRASTALILVPNSLQVQWLVELSRRFGIKPKMYHPEEELAEGQVYIAQHSSLQEADHAIYQHNWDVVVVDETHHVPWEPENQESPYQRLKHLTDHSDHVILLSATPEQLGLESHFGRLQLLDSDKFNDLAAFIESETQYAGISELVNRLIAEETLSDDEKQTLTQQYQIDWQLDVQDIINDLIDRHGTGRVVFRNTRSAVKGFPTRTLHTQPQEDQDSKLAWLDEWLTSHKRQKTLLICQHKEDILEIEQYLWDTKGYSCALFHEDMTLIERDRAAAYFADNEQGTDLLLCSEIGSEGRNFQFCQHLICFDLPDNPDILEQRIGRLDRIGQQGDVNIWVPFIELSDEDTKLTWYHDVLNCFVQNNPAANTVHDKFYDQYLIDPNSVIEEAKDLSSQLLSQIQSGRDKLLELSSCRQPFANELVEKITEFEANTPQEAVEAACDALNIHLDDLGDERYVIQPSDNMLVPFVPGVPEEGGEITYSRELALARDDVQFISWDSPLVQGLWELLNTSEIGTATLAILPSKQLPPGKVILESLYAISIQSKHRHEIRGFLEDATLRVVNLESSNNDLSAALPEDSLHESLTTIKPVVAKEIIQSRKDEIRDMSAIAETLAKDKLAKATEQTLVNAQTHYLAELTRLQNLQQKNPLIDDSDLDALKEKIETATIDIKENLQLQLHSVRLIVTAP